MNTIKRVLILYSLLLITPFTLAQPGQQIINIGNFKTLSGLVINNAALSFRTLGEMNTDKSNVVIWPTWFTGTSEDIIKSGMLDKTLDTSGLYIILLDSLGNGASSSPSNTLNFPDITLADMVEAQHRLLVNHLNIKHVRAVMGISMGGMQALEWMVRYPNYMDKVVSIAGAPSLTSYDNLVWQAQVDLLEHAMKNKQGIEFALQKSYDIFYMNLSTPQDFSHFVASNNVKSFMAKKYQSMMAAKDYLVSVKALMSQNIFQSANLDLKDIHTRIKADVLIILSESDQLVNSEHSLALAKAIKAKTLVVEGNKGHMAVFLQNSKIQDVASEFLHN